MVESYSTVPSSAAARTGPFENWAITLFRSPSIFRCHVSRYRPRIVSFARLRSASEHSGVGIGVSLIAIVGVGVCFVAIVGVGVSLVPIVGVGVSLVPIVGVGDGDGD